jgi:hypothetical protein
LHPIKLELYSFGREDRKWRPRQGRHSGSLRSTAKAEQPRLAGGLIQLDRSAVASLRDPVST